MNGTTANIQQMLKKHRYAALSNTKAKK